MAFVRINLCAKWLSHLDTKQGTVWAQQATEHCHECEYLQTGDGELGDEFDHFRVVVHLHQFTELVVWLEPSQQTTELMIVAGVWQALHSNTLGYVLFDNINHHLLVVTEYKVP